MIELSRRRTLESKSHEEGNIGKPPRLFSLDMIPIDGCFKDVLQQWPLFFDVNCSPAAGHRRLLQGCLAAVAAVLRRQVPPTKWWESLTCCEQQNTRREEIKCCCCITSNRLDALPVAQPTAAKHWSATQHIFAYASCVQWKCSFNVNSNFNSCSTFRCLAAVKNYLCQSKEVVFLPVLVCLFVGLFFCPLDCSKSYERILMKS